MRSSTSRARRFVSEVMAFTSSKRSTMRLLGLSSSSSPVVWITASGVRSSCEAFCTNSVCARMFATMGLSVRRESK